MAEKVEGAAVGSVGLSVLAVALITVVWPLVMGGSVALAVSFAGEVKAADTPDDFNGFRWLETGSCTPSTNTWTSVSVNYYQDDLNFTSIGAGSGTSCYDGTNTTYELLIPPDLLDQNSSVSRITFNHRSNTFSGGLNGEWFFDYAIKVNGTTVASVDDYNINAVFERSTTQRVWTVNFDHELDGVELLNLRSELGDCGDSCQVSVAFTNFREGEHTGYDYQAVGNPFPQGKVRMEVFTTDPELEGLVMTLSPWIVSVLTLGVAVGSTRFWDPLRGVLSR